MTLLQISDPHFGTERPQVVEALLELARTLAPDVIVMSGDITQRARRAQFAAASRFCDRLPACALVAVPGNHDIPLFNVLARLFDPYRGYRRAFGPEREGVFAVERLLLITLDTTRWYRHKDGEVSVDQIERTASRLSLATSEQVRVVAMHHPVLAIEGADLPNLSHGHEAAVRRFAQAGADLVLGGHIHLPYVRNAREQWPDLARDLWVMQAGTSVSSRIRHGTGNSVNVIRPGAGRQCAFERWDFIDARGTFVCMEAGDLALDLRAPEMQHPLRAG